MHRPAFLDERAFLDVVDRWYPPALREREVRWAHYREALRPHARAAEVAATVAQREVLAPLCQRRPGRFVCRLERHRLFTKSPAGIDEKLFRFISHGKVAGVEFVSGHRNKLEDIRNRDDLAAFVTLIFRDLPDVMNDLGRFRIVGNYLSDVQDVAKAFATTDLSRWGIRVDPAIEDRIEEDRWEDGAGGHRAIHLRLWVRGDPREVPLEAQLMTLLEAGWSEKSHRLYELARRGACASIDKATRLRVRAMSDALYVADALFDEVNRARFEPSDEGER